MEPFDEVLKLNFCEQLTDLFAERENFETFASVYQSKNLSKVLLVPFFRHR
jgi:hypothetical protein